MEVTFEAKVLLTIEHRKGDLKSKHKSTDFNLYPGPELDKSKYLDDEHLPTADGSSVLSNVLVQGLVGNIHLAHEKGFRDSAEHLRWIISELERGFINVTKISKSEFS